MSKGFGPEYYKRFYRDQAVHNKTLVTQLGTAVFSMCKWWGLTTRPFDVTFCHGILQYLEDADGFALWKISPRQHVMFCT